MKKKAKSTPAGRPRRTDTVKMIRGIFGRTQTELAAALGVSPKAVQSYEQGWRKVPVRVMIQMLEHDGAGPGTRSGV